MFLNFLLMENLGIMANLRNTGFRGITDRDVLDLHCIYKTTSPQIKYRPRGYKAFFMLTQLSMKFVLLNNCNFFLAKHS